MGRERVRLARSLRVAELEADQGEVARALQTVPRTHPCYGAAWVLWGLP